MRTLAAGFAMAALFGFGGSPIEIPVASSAVPDDASISVRILPPAPVQGDTLIVVVHAPSSSTARARMDGIGATVFGLSSGVGRALLGTDPTVATGLHTVAVTITSPGGAAVRASRSVRINPGHFEIRTLTLPPKTFGLITPRNGQMEREALSPVLARRTPAAMWSGPFVVPSGGVMDSPYGYQSYYNGQRMWWHQGVDFAAADGAPVVAANAGVVALAQKLPLGGNTVVIDHGQGVLTEYLHLSAFAVHVGDHVGQGALIAQIGATGLVTGPSLHWGLYVNGTWVNPLFWLTPPTELTR